MSNGVLVLNSDYEPLNVCNIRRAVSMVLLGKVEVLHENSLTLNTISVLYRMPSVVRLRSHISRPRPQIRLSRRNVLVRDNYTCQYCGHKNTDLTIDHIIPKRLNGPTSWENLVCCCKSCNFKKGDKTNAQIGFVLSSQPTKPKYLSYMSITKFASSIKDDVWKDYLPIPYRDNEWDELSIKSYS